MGEQLPLFSDSYLEKLGNFSDTSQEALESINHSRLEKTVLSVIKRFGEAGCIADEIRRELPHLAYSSVTARFRALLDDGSIEVIGTRKGDSGRAQRVFVATKNPKLAQQKSKVMDTMTHNYTMNEYQADAAETMIYKWRVIYPALGLANEAGEVAGKIKKMIRDEDLSFNGSMRFTDAQRAAIAGELGDVLWYIAALARDLHIPLNDVANMNIEKLQSRKERGVLGGSGDNR